MKESSSNYSETEMDLKGFFRIIAASKKTVISVTLVVTIIASIYTYTQTPIYEATALIKIGSYKTKKDQVVEIESVSNLVKVLQTKYLVIENRKINKIDPKVTSILAPKKTSGFIEIKTEAVSNKLAISKLSRIALDLMNTHEMVIKGHESKVITELDNLKARIESIKFKEKGIFQNQIDESIVSLKSLVKDRASIEKKINKIEKTNPVLALVKYADKQILSADIFKTHSKLGDLKLSKIKLTTETLYKNLEDQKKLELLLLPYNLKNTQIVGGIVTYDHPIRPMTNLVIIISFIAGLLLSIFIVFTRRILKED